MKQPLPEQGKLVEEESQTRFSVDSILLKLSNKKWSLTGGLA
jgi:hypothetical protein